MIRSGGVRLLRANSVEKFEARLLRQAELEDRLERFLEGNVPTLLDLWAEDTTVGWRFEVLDDASPSWRQIQAAHPGRSLRPAAQRRR